MQRMYVRVLRYLLICGVFLSLAIPFIVANGVFFPDIANFLFPLNAYFPFITGKNFVFRILVELLFGCYVLLALREPKYRPRFSWVLGAIVAFVVWVGFALLFSVDPVKSFWSNFERMEGYITILHLLLYFIILCSVLSAERLWNWYLRLSVFASVIMSFYGIAQLLHWIPIDQGGVRLDGTLGNADYFAVYMLFSVFFAFVLLYREWEGTALRWVYAVVALLDVVMLFFSETRGTILGLVGGLIVAALYIIFAGRHDGALRGLRRLSMWSLGVIAILVVAFFALRTTSFIAHIPGLDRLASISFSNPESTTRLVIWQMAFEGFKEKPIFGWGQDNFNFVFNKYYNPVLYSQEAWFDRAHNAFLDWLMNSGVLGFVLFVGLFVAAAWTFMRTRELSVPERAIFLGLVAGFAFHELFVFDNLVSYLQFFALLALAHGLSQREVPRAVTMAQPLGEQGMAIVAPIVVVVVLAGVWFLNIPGIANAVGLIPAISTQSPTGAPVDLTQNLSQFQKLLAGSLLGRQEVTEQMLQFAMAVGSAQSVTPNLKQNFYTVALSAITEMNKERPHDARLELFAGVFLDAFGQYPVALTQLQNALADSPKKQEIFFEIGLDNRIPAGDYGAAVQALQSAYNLDQTYDQARIDYADALYYTGQQSQADQLLQARFGTTTPDDSSLLQAYFATKQFSRAEAMLKNRIAANPGDTQSMVQLAVVYYNAGDKVDAIATLQGAAKIDPAFASQATQLIQQIQAGK